MSRVQIHVNLLICIVLVAKSAFEHFYIFFIAMLVNVVMFVPH